MSRRRAGFFGKLVQSFGFVVLAVAQLAALVVVLMVATVLRKH